MRFVLQIGLLLFIGLVLSLSLSAAIARDGSVVSGNSNSTSLALTKSPTAGATVLVGISYRKAICNLSATAITDNGTANTYSLDKDVATDAQRNLALYHAFNISAGVTTITIHTSATCAIIGIVQSYTGMTSATVDQVTAAAKTGTGTAATSNSITTTGSNDLLWGACLEGDNSTTTWTATGGSGWTLTASKNEGTNGSVQGGEDQINIAVGTYNAAMTASGSVTWWCLAASYSDGVAGVTVKKLAALGVGMVLGMLTSTLTGLMAAGFYLLKLRRDELALSILDGDDCVRVLVRNLHPAEARTKGHQTMGFNNWCCRASY